MAAGKNTPTAYAGSDPYIFVSYAHKDSDKAFPFIAALQKCGYNVWFDAGIRYGNEWRDEIANKLAGCAVFIFLVSETSLKSKNCKKELYMADGEDKPFVNVLIERISSFPNWYKLGYDSYQNLPLYKFEDFDEAVEALANDVSEMKLTRSSGNPAEGSFIEFGSYPQRSDGERALIEWMVLKNDGQKALLISRYCLDVKPYNEELIDVTWGTCSLREWLNEIFVSEAFNADEQKLIIRTTVTADRNPKYRTSPGNNTTDKVFLLSITEVKKYFSSIDARKCVPTDYAKVHRVWTNGDCSVDDNPTCMWWLRSPGDSSRKAARVISDGSVSNRGRDVNYGCNGIRPALWIDSGSLKRVSEMAATRSSAGADVEKKPPETAKADTDSAIRATIETAKRTLAELKLRTADFTEGSFVEFGSYPQSAKGEIAPIEWLVLAKKGDKALVISKYALDCQKYNTSSSCETWGTCSLRKWLNGTFINNAFSSDEQNMIQTTTVTADKNPSYSTFPGNNTTDKVFLLSIHEVKKYFGSNEARKCAATDYAISNGADTDDEFKTCWWWLRSPGEYSFYAAYVHCGGFVDSSGGIVNAGGFAVRPALWINLES